MSALLRRLPLPRLLLLCAVVVAVGVGATALALAVGAGPVPAPKPLAQALHDALAAPAVSGVSARIQLTDHLIEGASLADNGKGEVSQLASNPLLTGASGRLWVASDGRARLELQDEKGDTQILYDGHTVSLYDASTNTLYRYTPPTPGDTAAEDKTDAKSHEPPSAAKIQEGIERLRKHANVSEATPTDVASQPAYTVRISPREHGGLIGGAELSFDAVHGVPLRAAVYSTDNASPVIELAATEISYGQVASSTLDFSVPSDAKVQEVKPTAHPGGTTSTAPDGGSTSGGPDGGAHPHVSLHGEGLEAIAVVESPAKPDSQGGSQAGSQLEGLKKVDINGTSASELPTALGTLLSFERSGVRYLLAGAVTPAAIETLARSL